LFFMTFPDLEFAPPKRKAPKESNTAGNEDAESVVGQGERGPGMTASRSSSLTLPNPPAVAGSSAQQHEKTAQGTAAAALPPQPTSINGVATQNLAPGLGKGKIYEPRIYGFKVSERAKGGPRMKWLRSRPQDVNTLDEARLYHEVFGGEVDGELEQKTPEESTPANVPHDNDGDAVMAGQSKPVARKSSKRKGPLATATRRNAEDPDPPEAG
jgi:casein kinase II subunit beta